MAGYQGCDWDAEMGWSLAMMTRYFGKDVENSAGSGISIVA
jgi:hypothetical protein